MMSRRFDQARRDPANLAGWLASGLPPASMRPYRCCTLVDRARVGRSYRCRGFTLVELMTVVVIVAIIAAFAIPAFTEQLRRSRRAEAVGGLQDFQLKMERWRGGHPSYANVVPADAEYPAQPTTTFYRFSIQGTPTATTYTLRATGLGPQSTGPCRIMEFQVSGTATVKAPPVATTSCWR